MFSDIDGADVKSSKDEKGNFIKKIIDLENRKICIYIIYCDVLDKKSKVTSQQNSNINSSRNLWISCLSSSTRATDLKQVFSKYGKVLNIYKPLFYEFSNKPEKDD